MVGALGKDQFGDALHKFLQAEELDLNHINRVEGSTGTAVIVVDKRGENSIVIIPGANYEVTPHLLRDLELSDSDTILLQDEIPEDSNVDVIRRAKAVGARTVLNLAPFRPTSPELLELVDFLVLNETEFAQLVDSDVEEMSTHRVAGLLAEGKASAQNIVVTLGAEGLHARLGSHVVSIAGHKVPVTDTTGAGDSFCGALGAALAKGLEPSDALHFANAAAALSVQRLGAGPSMPTIDEVEAFMRTLA
jgi:ribokinase